MNDCFLRALPFHIGTYVEWPKGVPETLPFSLTIEETTGLITEVLTPEIESALRLFYERGGYGSTPLGEGEYGKRQGEEVFEWITRSLESEDKQITETSFLEIGAGYGYLLYLLKQKGAMRAVGIEPGAEGVVGAKKYDVEMIQDFFPTPKLQGMFEYILSYGVLEHITSPASILREIVKSLTNDGVVFIAVPESERKMRLGDPSVIAHQHVNYFTKESLTSLLRDAGFAHSRVEFSPRRSMLFAWTTARNSKSEADLSKRVVPETNFQKNLLELFQSNLLKNIARVQEIISHAESEDKTVGFYAPCSSLLGLVQFKRNPRIFDTDRWKHGKYIAGVSPPFEPPEALRSMPVDLLFVCPLDYDMEIKNYLTENDLLGAGKMKVVSLKEMYEHTSGTRYVVG